MTNQQVRDTHLADTTDLYADISAGNLPAVSFVKPGGKLDGHPTSSKFGLYEAFVRKIVDAVQSNPKLWASTAILITVDEGGRPTMTRVISSQLTSSAMAHAFR